MPIPFLTARWSNVCLFNYAVPASLLSDKVPSGLELDTRDGQAFVSLVAFDFHDTRVLGVPWPGYVNFPELNLRFYVRCGLDRGVVFIREIVPSRLVAWVARVLYNEPYRASPLESRLDDRPDHITATHRLTWEGHAYTISATGGKPPFRPPESSTEHFFKEHRWGFGISRSGRTIRYEVRHEVWDVYPVTAQRVDLDWTHAYGPEWTLLNGVAPSSTVLAVGSPVSVFSKGRVGGL